MDKKIFDDIRSYNDNEVSEVLPRMLNDVFFLKFVKTFVPHLSARKIIDIFSQANNIKEFQNVIVKLFMEPIIQASITNLNSEGLENLDKNKAYIFLSNHRDIVLDSALINYLLNVNEFKASEIAIGDNLLIFPWITDLVKLNKSFVVKRDVPVSEMMKTSINLSEYIRYGITEKENSIWIAQREGRTKDGNDATQISLLKMLGLSGSELSFGEKFSSLNIVPVSISYEYESCDMYKVAEAFSKYKNPDHKKSKQDDLNSMFKGIVDQKGGVNIHFGAPINEEVLKLDDIKNKNKRFIALAEEIDKQIFNNFKLWKNNYIAYDILNNTSKYSDKYSDDDKVKFVKYIEEKSLKISLSKDDLEWIRTRFYEMYSNPVENSVG